MTGTGPESQARTITRLAVTVPGMHRERLAQPAFERLEHHAKRRIVWVAGVLVGAALVTVLVGMISTRSGVRSPGEPTSSGIATGVASPASRGPDAALDKALDELARSEPAPVHAGRAAPLPSPVSFSAEPPPPRPQADTAKSPPPQPSIADLVERVGPSIVTVRTRDASGESLALGSGFLLTRWRVATNHHVVEGAESVTVRYSDGTTARVVGMLADDRSADLAILQLESEAVGRSALTLARATPRAGDALFVIGSPLGLEQTVSDGRSSGLVDYPGRGLSLQVSAPISPGSSGGPVFNDAGDVVGVARFTRTDGQNINFAVPVDLLRALVLATPSGSAPRPFPPAPRRAVEPPASGPVPEPRPRPPVALPSPAPLPPPPSVYGAIAFNPRTGQYGWSWNAPTQAAAENAALEKVPGRHAQVVVWTRDGWCALARSRDGAVGWAQGATREYVVAAALAECQKQSTAACYIALAFRADGTD